MLLPEGIEDQCAKALSWDTVAVEVLPQSGRGGSVVRIAICQDGRGPYARMVEDASCLPEAGCFRKLYSAYLGLAVDLQFQEFSFHSMDTEGLAVRSKTSWLLSSMFMVVVRAALRS